VEWTTLTRKDRQIVEGPFGNKYIEKTEKTDNDAGKPPAPQKEKKSFRDRIKDAIKDGSRPYGPVEINVGEVVVLPNKFINEKTGQNMLGGTHRCLCSETADVSVTLIVTSTSTHDSKGQIGTADTEQGLKPLYAIKRFYCTKTEIAENKDKTKIVPADKAGCLVDFKALLAISW
jgi:hypothetical protein